MCFDPTVPPLEICSPGEPLALVHRVPGQSFLVGNTVQSDDSLSAFNMLYICTVVCNAAVEITEAKSEKEIKEVAVTVLMSHFINRSSFSFQFRGTLTT